MRKKNYVSNVNIQKRPDTDKHGLCIRIPHEDFVSFRNCVPTEIHREVLKETDGRAIWVWWCAPVIPAPGKWRQDEQEFKVLQPVWATPWSQAWEIKAQKQNKYTTEGKRQYKGKDEKDSSLLLKVQDVSSLSCLNVLIVQIFPRTSYGQTKSFTLLIL